MPGGNHKNPLDTRRSRGGSYRQILRDMEGVTKNSAVPVRTGRRQGITSSSARPFPEPGPDWLGTLPEWAIDWAHHVLGKKPGEDYQYISYVAGIQVDFEEYDLQLVLNIQGLYWHYEFAGGKQIEDRATRAIIEATGITLINIDEDNALADPVYYLKEALAGRDHSLQARGIA
jgi:hypothetical protein